MSHELREQDRWLPIANVARLMKTTLPPSAKVSKDAKECMQECVSEFISFITSEASDNCLGEKRKTINGEDILLAMTALGFENYSEVLKIYLTKYRQQQALRQERGETRKRNTSFQSSQGETESLVDSAERSETKINNGIAMTLNEDGNKQGNEQIINQYIVNDSSHEVGEDLVNQNESNGAEVTGNSPEDNSNK